MRIGAAVVGEKKTVERIKRIAPGIRVELKTAVQRLTLKLLARTKQQKLSGQVLNVRTGRLRRSINQRVESKGTRVDGYVGTNVEYARVHEFGFRGIVNIREHLRKTKRGAHKVSAHSRNVNIRERSFLRSALGEMKPTIQKELKAAAVKVAKVRR